MLQVFPDSALNSRFARDGYAVAPFLDPVEIAELRKFYDATVPDTVSDFWTTLFDDDIDRQQRVSAGIAARLQNRLAATLPGHQLFVGSFISKSPGKPGQNLAFHYDWTLVDRARHVSVHLWCPLQDVTEGNGCLRVVAGSHTLPDPPHIAAMPAAVPPERADAARAASLRSRLSYNPAPFDPVRSTMESECVRSVPMKAGEMFFFHEALLHASGHNASPEPRIAIGGICLPKGVPARAYTWDYLNPEQLNIFELKDAFSVRLGLELPVGGPDQDGVTWIGTVDYRPEQLTEERLAPLRETKSSGARTDRPRAGWFSRLFRPGA